MAQAVQIVQSSGFAGFVQAVGRITALASKLFTLIPSFLAGTVTGPTISKFEIRSPKSAMLFPMLHAPCSMLLLYSLDFFFPEQPCRPDKKHQQQYEESKSIFVSGGNKSSPERFHGAQEQSTNYRTSHAAVTT